MEAWVCILEHLVDRRHYGSSSTYRIERTNPLADALFDSDDKVAGQAAMLVMAVSSTVRHTILDPGCFQYHWVFIIRILCKTTKLAVDVYNRRHRRYMYANSLDALSPWARCEAGFYLSKPNPYRKLDREKPKEDFNNRKNRYKIRIMWKEYCDQWKP